MQTLDDLVCQLSGAEAQSAETPVDNTLKIALKLFIP
jgi:hypothetical protein